MEYELYKQLFNKVKLKGMNSVFGLKKMFIIGETSIVALAVCIKFLLIDFSFFST